MSEGKAREIECIDGGTPQIRVDKLSKADDEQAEVPLSKDDDKAVLLETSKKRTNKKTKGNPVKIECVDGGQHKISRTRFFKADPLIKDVIIPDGITSIAKEAFKDNEIVETVLIPESVAKIGESCFCGAKKLRRIVLPSRITELPTAVFQNCESLTEVILPERLNHIGQRAFCGDTYLQTLNLPSKLTVIFDGAFKESGLQQIEIPDSVFFLGDNVFSNCKNLNKAVLPSNINSIPKRAFFGCKSLRECVIPNSVREIKPDAFCSCFSLKKVIMGYSVRTIGSSAFSHCEALEEVSIPSLVETIGSSAFSHCEALKRVFIPDSVKTIEHSAFQGCSALKQISVAEDCIVETSPQIGCDEPVVIRRSANFKIEDKMLIEYKGKDTNVTIPIDVTRIDDNAFFDNENIERVIIPEGVTSIGGGAFWKCKNLNDIEIPEGVVRIEANAFTGCESLIKIDLPSTITSIGESAFCNCKKLKEVELPSGITSVGADAFLFCNCIEYVKIPYTLTDIGDDAFKFCSSLKTVIVYGSRRDSAVLVAMKENFSDDVEVIWGDGKQAIAKKDSDSRGASDTYRKMNSASFDKKATSSSRENTMTSKSDEKKTASSSKNNSMKGEQGNYTEPFSDVISFQLPNEYQMIWKEQDDGSKECRIVYGEYTDDNGKSAYQFFASVAYVEIENTEDDIIPEGEKPFDTIHRRDPQRRYVSISKDPEAEIQVKETPINILGNKLKYYLLGLLLQESEEKVAFIMGVCSWDEDDESKNKEPYQHIINIIKSVRYNGKTLPPLELTSDEIFEQLKPDFEGKDSVIKGRIGLEIRSGDQVISEGSFSGDDDGNVHFEDDHHAPSSVDGKYSDYEIKDGGITGTNKKLTRIEIPDGVTSIDDSAFEDYKNLTEVVVPESVRYIGNSAFSGCVRLEKINIPEGVGYINAFAFKECKNLTEIILPESIKWIGMYAFCDCIKLASINIHEYITQIFSHAFQNCAALTRIELPYGLSEISSGLFDGCKKLETVMIPETVTSIGSNAFDGCKKLKGVVIPATVDKIGEFAFNECQSLTQIEIPEGVETLGDLTFSDCTGLTSVTLPSSLTAIEDYAFHGCKRLKKINIPAGIEKMGRGVFGDCEKLTEIALPASLTEISDGLLEGCAGLKEVGIPDDVTTIGCGAFRGCSSLASITLPQGIEAIADNLFNGCSSLKTISIPESVETIGDQAFNACTALTEVTIPDGVKTIGDFAFDDCTALKRASLPSGVELGNWAFPHEVDVTYRLGNGRVTKRKPDSTSVSSSTPSPQAASDAETVGKYSVVTPSDELYFHYGKLKRHEEKFTNMGVRYESNNGTEHEAIPLTRLMERQGKTDNPTYRKLKAIEANDHYDLKETALLIAQVFRVDQSVFNARHDDEGEIGVTLLDKKWKFSALRSFAWTLADLADREGRNIDDYDEEDLSEICNFIEERKWLNYEEGSWFDGLCGHPDLHVFYMPQKMIDDGSADGICDILKPDPIVSLDAFRNDLDQLKNAMIRIHNRLLENRDRSVKLDSPEAAVLKAWCAMVMSAEYSFVSEDGPMFFIHSYPEDDVNTRALPVGAQKANVIRAAPKAKKAESAASLMDGVANYEFLRGADGKERIKLGEYPAGSPITWLVLERNGQELLLLSEYALDAKPFCEGLGGITTNEWHNSTLRTWLNEDFYNEAFSDDEREMILEDTHDTYKKTASGIEETPPVADRVFLLSAREVNEYFPHERDRICRASAYAKEQGAEIEGGPNQCSWWLRSPAVEMIGLSMYAASIRGDGSGKGWGIFSGETCARPVIRVKSSRFVVSALSTGGALTGTGGLSERSLTGEEKEAIQSVQNLVDEVHSDLSSLTSTLDKHREGMRKIEEEKQQKIEEAKKKGMTGHDEVDMLAVLLNEESLGQLDRDENEFTQIYEEDFGAYDEQQLIGLRRKVLPTIHDESMIEAAKADMLSRSLEERFTISTANHFNVSPDWSFDEKANAAIEATKLWYRDSEIPQLRERMEEHKEDIRQRVSTFLTSFRPEWTEFRNVRNDLHISISNNSDAVQKTHNLFHIKLDRDLDVKISLSNPALSFISIPVMNMYASCWRVTPEEIWSIALQNEITDERGTTAATRRDALTAREKALSQIGRSTASHPAQVGNNTPPENPNAKRIKELEEAIAALQKEADSISGLFGFVKRNRIKKEMEEKRRELDSIKLR